MSRATSWATATLVAALLLATAGRARAADKLDKLAEQLATSDDFRVRTQAALALGAAKSKRAVDPLCKGLEDSSTAVRAASAAALGKLKLGGAKCLERRLDDESNASVKASIKKAIALVGSGSEPAISGSTKYYVAIGKTTDKTGRDGERSTESCGPRWRALPTTWRATWLLPTERPAAQATKRLSKFKQVTAFYLLPKVPAPAYAGRRLTIKVDIAVFTYPGKALKGMIPVVKRTEVEGTEDTEAEDDLIKVAAESALQLFAKNAERFE